MHRLNANKIIMDKKIKIGIVSAIILVLTIVLAMYLLKDDRAIVSNDISDRKIACTEEAKECPDGSYVGRTGPRCEFTPCPEIIKNEDDISDWKTYKNEKYGFEFQYPKDWRIEFPEVDTFSINLVSPETETEIKKMGEYPSADIMISRYKSVACMQIDCNNNERNLFDELQSQRALGIIENIKSVNINGINGYEAINLGMNTYYTLYLDSPNGVYEILFNLKSDRESLSFYEEHFLSTFRLTK